MFNKKISLHGESMESEVFLSYSEGTIDSNITIVIVVFSVISNQSVGKTLSDNG